MYSRNDFLALDDVNRAIGSLRWFSPIFQSNKTDVESIVFMSPRCWLDCDFPNAETTGRSMERCQLIFSAHWLLEKLWVFICSRKRSLTSEFSPNLLLQQHEMNLEQHIQLCWVLETRANADVIVTHPRAPPSLWGFFAVWKHMMRCHRIPAWPRCEGAFRQIVCVGWRRRERLSPGFFIQALLCIDILAVIYLKHQLVWRLGPLDLYHSRRSSSRFFPTLGCLQNGCDAAAIQPVAVSSMLPKPQYQYTSAG